MYFKKSYQRSVANTVFKKITLAKQSERSYLKKLHKLSKTNWVLPRLGNSEAQHSGLF
jgi:hypothetical protein